MKKSDPKKSTAFFDLKSITFSFMLLIIITTGFNAFLSTLAFKNIYTNSILSQYQIVGNVLKKKIELSLHFGKKIEGFFGMEALLHTNLRYLTNLISNKSIRHDVHIFITDSKGRILYTTEEDLKSKMVSDDIFERLKIYSDTTLNSTQPFKKNHRYYIPLTIKNWDNSDAAIQVISFPEKIITAYLKTIIKESLTSWLCVLLISFFLLLLLFYVAWRQNSRIDETEGNLSIYKNKKILYRLFFIIAACQILFSFTQMHKFSQHYLSINQDKADTLNLFMKDLVENLLQKGMNLKNLNEAEFFIGNLIYDIPEFNSIMISNHNGTPLYYADRELNLSYKIPGIQAIDLNIDKNYLKTKTLMGLDGKAGTISILISEKAHKSFLKKIFIDSSTTVLISIFFCVEIMILLAIRLKKKLNSGINANSTRIIRPVAFLYFFAFDLVVSFIPLYMKNLYNNSPEFIIPQNISLGLPIVVQMIFAAISILIVGSWCDKKGWQPPFFYGLLFSALGFLFAGIIKSPLYYLFSMAGAGFGYGLSYISAQNFVTSNSPPEKKAQGLSEYYAGCIAGSICGIATGGMLAEQVGFANVFLIGFIILMGIFLWAFYYMKPYFIKPVKPSVSTESIRQLSLFHFFLDKKSFFLIYLNIIPAAVILAGFMNFFIPVYLQNNGTSQSDIGRIYMVFGICLIYISPFITKRINTEKHSIYYITLGGILGSMSLLTFIFISGYAAVIISILFLGLGASFNALRNAYALNMNISKKIGEGRTSSLIFFHARLGQALGPVVFAWLAVTSKDSSGIIKIGAVFLILSFAFLILNHLAKDKKVQ